MIDLVRVAELDVSAASGLVARADTLCVVADDETFLAVYRHDGTPMSRVALLRDEPPLPEPHAERKRRKPDFEALVELPDGRLLALGSGSTPARMRGVLIDPARDWAVRTIDLSALYGALARELPELNLEGAAVHAERLWLAQRGNGASAQNACVQLDLAGVLRELDGSAALGASTLQAITRVDLGTLDGVPLGFTDLSAHAEHGLFFSAAAEASASTYDDGAVAGSVLGVLSPSGDVLSCQRLAPACKIEGLAVVSASRSSAVTVALVADPDDRALPAPLFFATFK
ncbi:MAG TPA: hypothetical protein VHM19_04350 [Polyangiales bacterium]|nr:hypothetical protein [Polyangiales bacterium]